MAKGFEVQGFNEDEDLVLYQTYTEFDKAKQVASDLASQPGWENNGTGDDLILVEVFDLSSGERVLSLRAEPIN